MTRFSAGVAGAEAGARNPLLAARGVTPEGTAGITKGVRTDAAAPGATASSAGTTEAERGAAPTGGGGMFGTSAVGYRWGDVGDNCLGQKSSPG